MRRQDDRRLIWKVAGFLDPVWMGCYNATESPCYGVSTYDSAEDEVQQGFLECNDDFFYSPDRSDCTVQDKYLACMDTILEPVCGEAFASLYETPRREQIGLWYGRCQTCVSDTIGQLSA